MKRFFTAVTIFSAGLVTAQVDIDKPVNLTGADGDRKITNLELPVDGTDAANKDYVDNSVSASGGGLSLKPQAISNESGAQMIFVDAVAYCEDLSEGGHSDWRIPTLQEALYFARSSMSSNYVWTLSETPSQDFGNNQNYISVRLSDGKWSNGGVSAYFFVGRNVSASSPSWTSTFTTVATLNPLTAGNTLMPTSITLTTGDGCSTNTESRLIYNLNNGLSITSPTYTSSGCGTATNLNNVSIPLFNGGTQLNNIQVQARKPSPSSGSVSLTVSGWETNYAQLDGNSLYVRCVR